MSLRVADRVEDWEERPYDGGYAGLHSLADAAFSGVVRAGGAELYMTAGTVVGIDRGGIEDFESATGTAYEAPVPALPLLCVMQAADADVRAQYYTEETPISEVDGTLSDGGFTGFVELSENVLSGDYFLVYHGGRSMAVGFVGAAEQLISGDEAFETADDEVGIYKVRQVDVAAIEIPEPAEPDAGAGDDSDESSQDAPAVEPAGPADEPTEGAGPTDESAAADPEPTAGDSEPTPDDQDEVDATASEPEPPAESESTADGASGEPDRGDTDAGPTPATSTEPAAEPADTRDGSPDGLAPDARSTESSDGGGNRREPTRRAESGTPAGGSAQPSGGGQGSRGGAADLETRSIPSLDPDRTHVPRQERATATDPEPAPAPDPDPEPASTPEPSQSPSREGTAADPDPATSGEVRELEDELAGKEAEIDELETALAEAETARDDLEAELEAVREERDDLADRVDDLEAELARLEDEMGAATDAERRMTPSEAIEGTNLFVDYDSKGAATLAKAHDGSESPADVAENLQLGVHTEFAEAGVAVNGRDFGEWLRSTLHYRFAEWVVSTLLFEIRDTGHADDLVDLYDAIPEIRRVEFNGAVDVEYVEDGQEKAGREHFDVIFRHRMGDPLLVANLNDSRDPATGSMMETLVTAAERVGQSADSLSTAVLVTSSFFESAALETVSEATRGGILSRDKRTSFVNLSRKTGYHLCLVAAREGNFHMEVPEL